MRVWINLVLSWLKAFASENIQLMPVLRQRSILLKQMQKQKQANEKSKQKQNKTKEIKQNKTRQAGGINLVLSWLKALASEKRNAVSPATHKVFAPIQKNYKSRI